MAGMWVKSGGEWKTSKAVWVYTGGAWRKAKAVWVFQGGVWHRVATAGITGALNIGVRSGTSTSAGFSQITSMGSMITLEGDLEGISSTAQQVQFINVSKTGFHQAIFYGAIGLNKTFPMRTRWTLTGADGSTISAVMPANSSSTFVTDYELNWMIARNGQTATVSIEAA